jgi:hypothetical protein
LTADPVIEAELDLSPADGESLALLHRSGVVLSTHYDAERVKVRARLRASLWQRLKRREEPVASGS